MPTESVIDPASLRQFGNAGKAFFLITDAALAPQFTIAESHYRIAEVVPVAPGADIGRLVSELPDESAVLVAAPGCFVNGADLDDIGGRRVAIMPCGSTPVRTDHLHHFLRVLRETDPAAQEKQADRFFETMAGGAAVRLRDDRRGTLCDFDPADDGYVWNQQAGELQPGEQQIAPAGELSVLPMEITDFDPGRRLRLNGAVTLRGEPIVHAGYPGAPAAAQADLYARLAPLRRHPVVAEIEDGVIVGCRAATDSPPAAAAAATLNELLTAEPGYRTVWELGFGINTAMTTVPANCGLNEVYGADHGVVHLGLGLTPFTRFALTFLCPDARLTVGDETLIGPPAPVPAPGRLNRNRSGSCGCH